MQREKPVRLASNANDKKGVFLLPRTPSRLTVKQEEHQPPVHQHRWANLSIRSDTLPPVKQEEILPSMSSTSTKQEQSPSHPGAPVPLVGSSQAHSSTGPLTRKPKNHLTNPTTGKIVVGAVPHKPDTIIQVIFQYAVDQRNVVRARHWKPRKLLTVEWFIVGPNRMPSQSDTEMSEVRDCEGECQRVSTKEERNDEGMVVVRKHVENRQHLCQGSTSALLHKQTHCTLRDVVSFLPPA
ncbi:hypothetical protein BKA83DRAFT_4120426 [Pisolithus microcarpus]|nr:hypothetical protein BKA83DRAFT_4120426 [Pisolithus microcarpus]